MTSQFPGAFILLGVGGGIIFLAFRYMGSRMTLALNRNSAIEQELEDLYLQLDICIRREQKISVEAEQADQIKQTLLSVMNHEIRTPINGVPGMASMLKQATPYKGQNKYTDPPLTNGKGVLSTINEILISHLLQAAKMDNSAIEPDNRDFYLTASLQEVCDMLSPKAEKKGLALQYQVDRNIPCRVNGDSRRLVQILLTLLEKAIAFAEHGEIRIKVFTRETSDSGRQELIFDLRHTGIGMAGIHFPDQENSLAVCKRLAASMGGALHDIRAGGKGLIFNFTILVNDSLDTDPHTCCITPNAYRHIRGISIPDNGEPEDPPTACRIPIGFAESYPMNILVAEDNLINQQLIIGILEKLGYQPALAVNGKEAVERLGNEPYDVVLMDVDMPEMDGLQATRMIRLCMETQPVIIAVTANAMQGDRERCLLSGMNDYISKPLELGELLTLLEKWATKIGVRKNSSMKRRGNS